MSGPRPVTGSGGRMPPGGPRRGPMGHGFGPMRGMGMSGEKARNFRGSLRRLVAELRPEMPKVVVVVGLAILGVVAQVIGPRILAMATDRLFEGLIGKQLGQFFAPGTSQQVVEQALREQDRGQFADMLSGMHVTIGAGVDFGAVGTILGILAGVYLVGSVFQWLSMYIMAGVSQRTVYRLRREVDLKLGRLPLAYYDSHPRGDTLSRVTNDIDNIANTLQQSMAQIISAVFTLLGVLIMMLTISPLLALFSLLVLPVAGVATTVIAKRSQVQFAAQWKETGDLTGHVEETHTGHSVVNLFGHREDAIRRFEEQNESLYQASFRAQFISGIIQPTMQLISNLNYVAIAVVGGLQVASGTMTLGDVQAFIQYSRQFTMPIAQTASIMNILQSTLASAERVFELLDEPEMEADVVAARVLPVVEGAVALEQVSFRYLPDVPLLDDLNVRVRPGETVAIVGPTGAGKTTVVNLLMRFYEIDAGTIRVDGVNTRELTRENLRRTFGMVLQDTWLFGGTIRDNIAYGRENATEEEIVAAAVAAHVDHFVRTMPDGYDTVIDDDASNLSQGEKQLLTIARAFLADPQILILDEATSSVDTRTEILVQRAMSRLMHGRTSFVIAHRLSTIRNADEILVMDHGRIVEQGTHDSLMGRGGFYADLYQSQFSEPLAEAV